MAAHWPDGLQSVGPVRGSATGPLLDRQHGGTATAVVFLNPFCPFTTAKVVALKTTVMVLLALLIKAKIRITAFSALGVVLLVLQTAVFLAAAAALYATQKRQPVGA